METQLVGSGPLVVFRVGNSEAIQGHDSGCISWGLNCEKGEAQFTSELKCLLRRFNMPETQFMVIQHYQMIMD